MRGPGRRALGALVAVGLAVTAATATLAADAGREDREPCEQRDPLRQPFFGDLHIHTRHSHDAASQGTVATPADAYRFARGEPLAIQPFDEDGRSLRTLQLSRPLDFAGVSDHAELFGEIRMCKTPGAPGYDSYVCRVYRGWPTLGGVLVAGHASSRAGRYSMCGDDGEVCRSEARTVWQDIRDAAERAYDRSSACRFTTLIGYEWTATAMPAVANLHRNVFYRSDVVPEDPISSIEAFPAEEMWAQQEQRCRGEDGCDWISIPHNSNISLAQMFRTTLPDGSPLTAETAAVRGQSEPIVEIYQHKGSSECSSSMSPADELCGFENLPWASFDAMRTGARAVPGPLNYVRNALAEGLVQHEALGANPFAFGIIASTDTHLAIAGAVSESTFSGHRGAAEPKRELSRGLVDRPEFSPGGLAVIWAEENSRYALFDALKRREVYGTSGPRIVLRFFGGWGLERTLCDEPDFVARADAVGVPMGGELAGRDGLTASPRFLVSALQDAGTPEAPGASLERVQIVKVWEAGGEPREQVFEAAAAEPTGAGSLCTVWQDPGFDPDQYAAYYARVLEQPTLRWHARICDRAQVDCSAPAELAEDLQACCDPAWPRSIRERAWSSPIWYTPR